MCPTCGPTTLEQHPRVPGVSRCFNCKEHLQTNQLPDRGVTMIEITRETAKHLVEIINLHEKARPDFFGNHYTEAQWDAITTLIVEISKG